MYCADSQFAIWRTEHFFSASGSFCTGQQGEAAKRSQDGSEQNEHSLVIGNIIGSNFFNALAVVGIAGVINPLPVEQGVIIRDVPLSIILTLSLFLFSIRVGRQIQGIISRFEGLVMLAIYTLYTVQLVTIVLGKPLFAFFV